MNDVADDGTHLLLRVAGKGGRVRVVPLSPMAWELCAARVEAAALEATVLDHAGGTYRLPDDQPQVWLLDGPRGGTPNRYSLARRLRRLAATADLDPSQISPQVLRYTAATIALNAGAPAQRVADLLGYRIPTTTMRHTAARNRITNSATFILGAALGGLFEPCSEAG